ncbi:GNAT family N-acetyltransferase [Paenibacillus sp. P96]|uniref:GNAT family N-acetyltransferase n=1 Tax=Paenibacillus zeirhizosphaerae TaxID=2987519 RepID=A0ABT9FL27_9BACL|nr:GNAT family N-acetyltransferase [Paenibacillus sp. P96]MDP4095431.1 GNAT family N-acetyltransferase [Paenibacillus sp. P96]
MIRLRMKDVDDKQIRQLIDKELVPLSHMSPSLIQKIRKELPRRLSQGMTYISYETNPSKLNGFIHLLLYPHTLIIDMLAVASKAQGKGVGKSLLLHAENLGSSKRCTSSRLLVDEGNVRGIQFYQRQGYSVIRHDTRNHCYEMSKRLSPY